MGVAYTMASRLHFLAGQAARVGLLYVVYTVAIDTCKPGESLGHAKRRRDNGTPRAPSGIGRQAGIPSSAARRVDNGMGTDGTEDGTTWANVQAIQLFPMWMGCKALFQGGVIWINKLQC